MDARAPEAELQARSAFLPGYVANSHVEKIASHLVKAVSAIAQKVGALSSHTAMLNTLLGVAASMERGCQYRAGTRSISNLTSNCQFPDNS